ncbi:MAG: YqaA family protein [Pseudomonadota bacterium]
MIRRLYDWTLSFADTRYAMLVLFLVSFAESSVFPIPPDILMIPMILAAPHRAWLIAGVCTLASVLGGGAGYYIGAQLFEVIGQPVLELYGKADKFDVFAQNFNETGPWAVLFAGITPFPYKVITIASGATGLDFGVFMVSSVVARGLRFFLVAALLWKFGPPIRTFIEKRFGLMTLVFFALLFGGFAAIRLL